MFYVYCLCLLPVESHVEQMIDVVNTDNYRTNKCTESAVYNVKWGGYNNTEFPNHHRNLT